MKETAPSPQHLPDSAESPSPVWVAAWGICRWLPWVPRGCSPSPGRAQPRPWVSKAWSPFLGSWVLRVWLGRGRLLPIPTEAGGSSQRSHPLPFNLACGAAQANRFWQQMASPWARLQPRGLSSSEGLVLGMHETAPPSGVSTDLSSMQAVLQPCSFAPRSAWLPVHLCITPNPAHSKQAPSCSQHTDIPRWYGADTAKPEGSKARASFTGYCHQPSWSHQALVQSCYPLS